jgi:hypothetical protein
MSVRQSNPRNANAAPLPQTIIEYLSQVMTTQELNQLYQDKFTVLTLFRTLPTLTKQYIVRLMLLQPLTPVPKSLILSWHFSSITQKISPINNDALFCMLSLKLLIKFNNNFEQRNSHFLRQQNIKPTTQQTDKDLTKEVHFYLNPYFHHSLRTALASTNPLQLHLSPFIVPNLRDPNQKLKIESNSMTDDDTNVTPIDDRSETSTATAAKKLTFKNRTKSVENNDKNVGEKPSEKATIKFRRREISTSATSATTTTPQPSKTSRPHQSNIRFQLPLPPLFQGNLPHLLSHILDPSSSPSSPSPTPSPTNSTISKTLPILDVFFLDTYSNDQINNISLYIFNLLSPHHPSLVYPGLPPTRTQLKSMGDKANNELIVEITGLSTFLIDLLHAGNIIQFEKKFGSYVQKVTKEGLNFILKVPQDRVWALLLMYFDAIRAHHKGSEEIRDEMGDGENQQNDKNDKKDKNASNVELMIPSLGNVFQFLFHLSFAPLGTALPASELSTDQLHVLFHLSEFGLLYPLYSTQIPPNPKSTHENIPTAPNSDILIKSHGLLAFYPTRLLTNLSSLKAKSFITTALKSSQSNRYDPNDDRNNEDEENLEAFNISSAAATPNAQSNTNNTNLMGVDSSTSSTMSITERAYASLTQDLSTPHGIETNLKKRFIIIETTLKVYAFTNNPLFIQILSYFVEFSLKLPNLCVGFITRKSVQNGINNGINQDQMVTWLTTHAHERMITKAMGQFDTTLNKYKNNSDIILPINVVNQIHIWATEQDRFDCYDVTFIDGFPSVEVYNQWITCARAEEREQKLAQIHPNKRPKTLEELTNFNWNGIELKPNVVLFKNNQEGKQKIIFHRSYFDRIKAKFLALNSKNRGINTGPGGMSSSVSAHGNDMGKK